MIRNKQDMSYSIREMRKEEYSLLSDFLYEAIYIPAGTAAPPKSVITCPELQVYIADFGNSKHDKALIAEVDGNIVGAIWARIMNDYGHIDEMIIRLPLQCPFLKRTGVWESELHYSHKCCQQKKLLVMQSFLYLFKRIIMQ